MVLRFDAKTMPEPVSLELDPVPLAVLSYPGIAIEGLTELFDDGFGVLGAAIADGGFVPAGPALAIYHGDPMETFDLEIGFAVATALPTEVSKAGMTIRPSVAPSGPAYARTYFGVYDGLGAAWAELVGSIAPLGASPTGVWIEVYVSEPGEPADRRRTDLVLPVER